MSEETDARLSELLAEVRRIEVTSDRLVTGLMAGAYKSVFRGSGIEFDEVREYLDGDDPRAVDWSVTARVGRPFVKTYVDERDLTVLFLLDLSASMEGGFGPWSARQTAARVCACLALSAVKNHDSVGLVAFSGEVDAVVPPRKGSAHALRIVRDTLSLSPSSSRTDLGPALRYASRMVRRHAVVFVVSDFMTRDYERSLAVCGRRHDVIAVRLGVPEWAPPEIGLARVRDPETGETSLIDWSSPAVRAAHEAGAARWKAESDEAFARARVDVIDVPIPRDDERSVEKPLLDFFRMRARRGAKR